MSNALCWRNVVKRFGSKQVLQGVDLEVPAGSIVGLLGTNGSGKTTLLKCAVGLLRPQAGQCQALGENAWNLWRQRPGSDMSRRSSVSTRG
jgi:ABC-2 type transport system ATP-binding protein